MVREAVVFLLVALEDPPLATLEGAKQFHVAAIVIIKTLDQAHILPPIDHLRLGCIDVAPAERQVINRIQEIGLPHTIVAHKAIQLRREGKSNLLYILIIENR